MNKIEEIFCSDPAVFAGSYFDYLSDILRSIDLEQVTAFVQTLLDARERGSAIFFIGNGGSASTASHFANDLTIGTNSYDKPFRVVSLTDNNAVITAIGNDFGFDDVFERQLRVLGKKDDVLIGISASGNSSNLLKAFDAAKEMGIKTFALTAFDGGKMQQVADAGIHVPTGLREYGPAEDAHLILNHVIAAYLKELLKKAS